MSQYGIYIVFHFNNFIIAVTFCQVTYFVAYNIDFILVSPVQIDDLRLGIVFMKSICYIIVQYSYESIIILKTKVESTLKKCWASRGVHHMVLLF